MEEDIHEPASVLSVFDADRRSARPIRIKWRNRVYPVREIGMHYTKVVGGVLHHIYSIVSGSTLLVLHLNTKTLFWTVEKVVDNG
jgi:hypothetical protein